jgi:hypothetical protein
VALGSAIFTLVRYRAPPRNGWARRSGEDADPDRKSQVDKGDQKGERQEAAIAQVMQPLHRHGDVGIKRDQQRGGQDGRDQPVIGGLLAAHDLGHKAASRLTKKTKHNQ